MQNSESDVNAWAEQIMFTGCARKKDFLDFNNF